MKPEIALMIEGQNGLNWPRWQRIAQAAEELGFVGLFRSDHFTNPQPPDLDALELWVSLSWLASHTRRLVFGPLVTPLSFRHPVLTAWMAAAVDDLSGGRLILGLGAGWQVREHEMFGFDLLPPRERFLRFEEGVEVIYRLLRSEEPVNFEGRFFRLKGATLRPRPQRPGGPPLLIGGNGVRRTLAIAARYADEWNAVFVPPERFRELNMRLSERLLREGRQPETVRRSLMMGLIFGRDEAEVRRKLAGRSEDALRARGVLIGTPAQIREQIELGGGRCGTGDAPVVGSGRSGRVRTVGTGRFGALRSLNEGRGSASGISQPLERGEIDAAVGSASRSSGAAGVRTTGGADEGGSGPADPGGAPAGESPGSPPERPRTPLGGPGGLYPQPAHLRRPLLRGTP